MVCDSGFPADVSPVFAVAGSSTRVRIPIAEEPIAIRLALFGRQPGESDIGRLLRVIWNRAVRHHIVEYVSTLDILIGAGPTRDQRYQYRKC